MRKIREALRLCLAEGLSPTLAGIATGLPRSTVRRYVLRAAEVGLATQEGWLTTRDLAEADEAFLSSSVAGILPVTRFEGSPIGSGLPGPWTAKARAAREAYLTGRPA